MAAAFSLMYFLVAALSACLLGASLGGSAVMHEHAQRDSLRMSCFNLFATDLSQNKRVAETFDLLTLATSPGSSCDAHHYRQWMRDEVALLVCIFSSLDSNDTSLCLSKGHSNLSINDSKLAAVFLLHWLS